MSSPEMSYRWHSADKESIFEMLNDVFESVVIRKSVMLCISHDHCVEIAQQLHENEYTALVLCMDDIRSGKLETLDRFLTECHVVLITTSEVLEQMSSSMFIDYIMGSSHNLFVCNDVPSYKARPMLNKIMQHHTNGFWDEKKEPYHVLWYLQ
jgi:hypothetical protein